MPKIPLLAALIGLLCAGVEPWPARATEGAAVPALSANGWDGDGENEFTPPKSGPGPVTSDPAHPYVSNFEARRTGAQANWRVADLSNPILKPWVIEALRKANAEALSGRAMFTREARCWPTGVPAMLLNPGRLYFVQMPKEVWIIQEADHRVRHVLIDQQHSASPQPTWYGESVGHYEGGDTLVIDTIGINDKTFVDSYRTPHTGQLHVVERFKLIDGGKALEVNFTVEDSGAFNLPWSASKRWKRTPAPLAEEACAENNANYFNYDVEPLPHADRPDF
ncbi:MAG TPA: hypothetical protein VGI22_13700 [Xanthobacteraceae bacterium]|jgi:hypothetical protein